MRKGIVQAILLTLAILPCTLEAQTAILPPAPVSEEAVLVETEKTLTKGFAAIEVQSTVPSSLVTINRVEVGYTIYDADGLAPGSYIIGVSAPGFRPRELFIILAEKTRYTLRFALQRLTGTLSILAEPRDAEISIDGVPVSAGSSEISVGTRTVAARRFGFREKRLSVRIEEARNTELSIVLDKAAFELSLLRSQPAAFNPRNAGTLGQSTIGFYVTAQGSATLSIFDGSGTKVAEKDFGDLETWDQGFRWDGRDPRGRPLPDGIYQIRLEARPAGSDPGREPILATASVGIDSSLHIGPRSALAASPGSLLFPDPESEAAGTVGTELTWIAALAGLSDSAFGVDAAYSVGGNATLAVSATAESAGGGIGSSDLAASFGYALTRSLPASALYLRASWSGSASPLAPYPRSGLELALPASLPLGPARLGLAPAFFLDLSGSSPAFVPLLRSALWLAKPSWQAGLSGSLEFRARASALSPSWPASLALELHLMPLAAPFVASASLVLRAGPGSSPAWNLGLGLGLIF